MSIAHKDLVRRLGDPSQSIREKALRSLIKREFPRDTKPTDWTNIFEGIFRMVWMADQPRYGAVTELLTTFLRKQVCREDYGIMVTSFWSVVNKNWTQIDKHRLNKFYLLIDKVIASAAKSDKEALCSTLGYLNQSSSIKLAFGLKTHASRALLAVLKGLPASSPLFLPIFSSLVDAVLAIPKSDVAVEFVSFVRDLGQADIADVQTELVSETKRALGDSRVNHLSRSHLTTTLGHITQSMGPGIFNVRK